MHPAGISAAEFITEELDSEGAVIATYVELEMSEAQDLAVVVENGFTSPHGSMSVADAQYICDQVTAILETELEETESELYRAKRGDAEEIVASEVYALLTFTKQFTSLGEISLNADGAIQNYGTDSAADIVADKVSMVANTSISGFQTSVNTITNIRSMVSGNIDIMDVDGIGDLSPGLELEDGDTVSGSFDLTSTGGFIVGTASAAATGASLNLTSTGSHIFVKENGIASALVSGDAINMNAAGDLTVMGNLTAPNRLEFLAGETVGTLGKRVVLDTDTIIFDSESTVTIDGEPDVIEVLHVTSESNINLIAPIEERSGFGLPEVVTPSGQRT